MKIDKEDKKLDGLLSTQADLPGPRTLMEHGILVSGLPCGCLFCESEQGNTLHMKPSDSTTLSKNGSVTPRRASLALLILRIFSLLLTQPCSSLILTLSMAVKL